MSIGFVEDLLGNDCSTVRAAKNSSLDMLPRSAACRRPLPHMGQQFLGGWQDALYGHCLGIFASSPHKITTTVPCFLLFERPMTADGFLLRRKGGRLSASCALALFLLTTLASSYYSYTFSKIHNALALTPCKS